MGQSIRMAFILAVTILLAGCFDTFSLIETDYRPKGKSIAVIAGLDSEANVVMAQRMTEALRKNTRFQVMPHKQAAQAIPNYPVKIKGPYSSAYLEIEEDYNNTDKKKIKDIQQKVGADYLYVVWTPTATVTQGTIHQLHVIAQMFEGPGAKEVGHGKYAATAGRVGGCCLVPKPDDKDKANAIDETSEYVAKEIGEKMGMLKK
ncbi:MAG: hypothetical protein OEW15_06465 [Nitrospirota bacterium]|nr:hypothetical protein [Nitrospirota bacterium]